MVGSKCVGVYGNDNLFSSVLEPRAQPFALFMSNQTKFEQRLCGAPPILQRLSAIDGQSKHNMAVFCNATGQWMCLFWLQHSWKLSTGLT